MQQSGNFNLTFITYKNKNLNNNRLFLCYIGYLSVNSGRKREGGKSDR